jgi:hypothetical protein
MRNALLVLIAVASVVVLVLNIFYITFWRFT